MLSITSVTIVKVFLPTIFSFTAGLLFAPAWLKVLVDNKMWKKDSKSLTVDGRPAEIFKKLHHEKELSAPRMGGVVIWSSTIVVALILWVLSQILPSNELLSRLDFISRSQTWIPLFALLFGATIGLIDDYLEVVGSEKSVVGGLSLKSRLALVGIFGGLSGYWFYTRLDVSDVFVPFLGDLNLGILLIPFFIITMLAVYSGGIIDGIDGLSGGVFASIFASYGAIALVQDQLNIATLCFVITGSILAFLWFNLPPARYYMTETGTMALTMCLTTIAFLTDQVLLLPIIAMPLVITPLSNILQLSWRKLFGKKLWLITPIHHHFEALGVPSYQITMKYWIVSVICALAGLVLALIG
jgi:phospho-N-acetylmuramoyl-pentapeptide-transferase